MTTTDDMVKCPKCRGRGFVVNPFAQRLDIACTTCAGSGEVDNGKICRCGRPAIIVKNHKWVCPRKSCAETPSPYNYGVYDPTSDWLGEEDDWRHWNELGRVKH
jgi:hypothetical protein